MENWLGFILIGLAAGFLAGIVVKGYSFGVIGKRSVVVVGTLLAASCLECWALARRTRWAIMGAIVLLILLRFIKSQGA
jgi:uncharacterized membrane protein YeaQ/YmgE (transglycosylase-associated protein family)